VSSEAAYAPARDRERSVHWQHTRTYDRHTARPFRTHIDIICLSRSTVRTLPCSSVSLVTFCDRSAERPGVICAATAPGRSVRPFSRRFRPLFPTGRDYRDSEWKIAVVAEAPLASGQYRLAPTAEVTSRLGNIIITSVIIWWRVPGRT